MAIRILEVVDNWYPIVDGVVNVVNNYASILNQYDDVECDVLCPNYPNTNDGAGNYKIIRTLSMSGGKFGVRLPLPMFDIKLKKYLKENHYDIIHVHSPVTLARTVVSYAKKNNIPTIFTIHTRYHEEINRSVKIKCLQKFALNFILYAIRRMDYMWAVSDGNADCLRDVYKINRPVKTVRNGTDISKINVDEANVLKEELKQKYNIKDDEKVLLFVGRLVVVKNISLILESVKMLKDQGEKYRLILVGDGDYRKKLEKEIAKLNLEDDVIFAGMVNDKTQLASYYLLADLFLFASTFDSCPLVTKEAAAMGLPTLLVKGSSSAEEIVDNHNGYVEELDAKKWANKIQEIFSNEEVLKEVHTNCKEELYQPWEKVLEKVLIDYREIAKLGKPERGVNE